MRISKMAIFLALIFIFQWVIMIVIPYILFGVFSRIVFIDNVFMDQLLKAIIAFVLVSVWLLEWMYMGIYVYRKFRICK
jgi:hypothetical protein